jgi:hypothetical protein
MRRWLGPSLFVIAVIWIAGCGGAAAPEAQSPEQRLSDEPENVDALLSRLAASERELSAELGPETPTTPAPEPPRDEDRAPEEPAENAPGKTPGGTSSPEPTATQPTTAPPRPSPCEVACRALGSMQRSAERICELTATTDARCTGARDRVTRAQARVERAGCGCER